MTETPEWPDSQSATNLLDILLIFERLKSVERQNPLSSDNRRENTAEHSWSVALAVLLFQPLASEELDIGRALALAVTHDLPEAFVGDTFVYGSQAESRAGRESNAMDLFAADTASDDPRRLLADCWREYESANTPESRFVLAVDVTLPIFMNSRNIGASSWKRHGVNAEAVRSRVRMIESWAPRLAELAYESIEIGVRQGALHDP